MQTFTYDCTPCFVHLHKFTGKERDSESGLDYFGARYYASNMGRWMSPDWADKPEAVPYSDLSNPQSLNLYGYVNNNPLSKADPDGHEGCCDAVLPALQNFEQEFPVAPVVIGVGAITAAVGIYENRGAIGDAIVDAAGRGTMMGQYGDMTKQAPVANAAAPPAAGEKANSGPKAADAPTVTANGQAANSKGEKLGPSRQPQGNSTRHNTEKGAKEAAARQSKDGTARKDANPKDGRGGHYHPNDTDRSASDHHYYPNNK